ncbi:MAG: hypothetical protein IKP36_01720 [Bacteroidaceae bacterium]|nr:hypothetical protein [Bacteroidaceae bacterium]
MTARIIQLLKKDAICFFMANILFSVSTMIINILLPKILPTVVFTDFIYIFQMVFFLTTVFQIGLVVGLYHFIEQDRQKTLNIYYLSVGSLMILLLAFALWPDNPLLSALNLNGIGRGQQMAFFASVIVSEIFLYNKGKNVADKDYRYMMRISVTVFLFRMIALAVIGLTHITDISLILALVFIIPFVQDIRDFVVNSCRYVRLGLVSGNLLQQLLAYSLKVWVIGALFIISDKMFLISTKGLDVLFTTALAFCSGFVGIISLFNSSFTNYFMSNLSSSRIDEIRRHINRLFKLAPLYVLMLLVVCGLVSGGIFLTYPNMGMIAPMVAFIILLRTGLISYLGMFSLLTKVMDMLNIEIALNVCRVVWTAVLCYMWQPENILIWFTIVTFMILLPELLLTIITIKRVNTQAKQLVTIQ